MTARHDGLLVAGPVLVITHGWLQTVLTAVLVAERVRGLSHLPPSPAYDQLRAALQAAISVLPPTETPTTARAHTNGDRWLTTEEAAEMLCCSPRQIRYLAPKLDGDRSTGRWLIPHTAVVEHLHGRR
jgi:hypothetical protein